MSHVASSTDDDYEIISSTDDASSITSGIGESDSEPDNEVPSSQTDSNITLKMPPPTPMRTDSSSSLESEVTDVGESRACEKSEATFSTKDDASALRVIFRGKEEYQQSIMEKLYSAFNDSETIQGRCSLLFSLPIETELDDTQRALFSTVSGYPVLFVDCIANTWPTPAPAELRDVPRWCIHSMEDTNSSFAQPYWSELFALVVSGRDFANFTSVQLSRCLSKTLPRQAQPCLRYGQWETKSLKKALYLGVFACIAAFYSSCALAYVKSSGLSSASESNSPIWFHQLTDTNALIELPESIRSQPVSRLPNVTATVKRDGAIVDSQLKVVVDNLYSVAWSPTEAYGELAVYARAIHAKYVLEQCYTISYAAKAPFLQTVSDKLKEINNLGQLAELETVRRVHEIVRQVDASRSHVLSISSQHLQVLRNSGAHGLKRFQETIEQAVDVNKEGVDKLLRSSARLAAQAHKQGSQQVQNARKGVEKVKKFLRQRTSKPHKSDQPHWRNFFHKRALKSKAQ